MGVTFGLQLWNQVFSWPEARRASLRAEELGYESLWTWEHALACMGEPLQDTFDSYTLLAAWSQVTSRVRLGVLTGANTFWNPGLLARKVTTLDHISGGRAICGIGGGWFEDEHTAFGIEFGASPGQRLTWLDESVAAIRRLFDGETVSSPGGGRYALRDAVLLPRPVQDHLPIMIGGSGERKTLRTVARYADMWNIAGIADLEWMRRKHAVFEQRCDEAGRNPGDVERSAYCSPVLRDTTAEAVRFFRTQMQANRLSESVLDDADIHLTTPDRLVDLMAAWKAMGTTNFIFEVAAPFDDETAERLATQVRPMIEAA